MKGSSKGKRLRRGGLGEERTLVTKTGRQEKVSERRNGRRLQGKTPARLLFHAEMREC